MEQAQKLKVENVALERNIGELRRNLEAVVLDAECLKDERVEIEKLLDVEESKEHGGASNIKSGTFLSRLHDCRFILL